MTLPAELARLFDSRTLPAIVVHGGAGTRTDEAPGPLSEGAARAAEVGFAVLKAGGSALDAVEAAVVFLEEFPLFNAGRGSCLTSDGTVEMDASIMDGTSLSGGAVASVRGVRSPIRLARKVITESEHLLLVGDGAERFAREVGAAFEPEEWFITPAQFARFEELKAEAEQHGAVVSRRKLGTVGAVAVDVNGKVAAATSTGGTAYKRPGPDAWAIRPSSGAAPGRTTRVARCRARGMGSRSSARRWRGGRRIGSSPGLLRRRPRIRRRRICGIV